MCFFWWKEAHYDQPWKNQADSAVWNWKDEPAPWGLLQAPQDWLYPRQENPFRHKTCRHFLRLRHGERPPDVEGLIRKHTLPVRPSRTFARQQRFQVPVSFTYRFWLTGTLYHMAGIFAPVLLSYHKIGTLPGRWHDLHHLSQDPSQNDTFFLYSYHLFDFKSS